MLAVLFPLLVAVTFTEIGCDSGPAPLGPGFDRVNWMVAGTSVVPLVGTPGFVPVCTMILQVVYTCWIPGDTGLTGLAGSGFPKLVKIQILPPAPNVGGVVGVATTPVVPAPIHSVP